jgi:hypothetical protein
MNFKAPLWGGTAPKQGLKACKNKAFKYQVGWHIFCSPSIADDKPQSCGLQFKVTKPSTDSQVALE